MTRKYIVLCLLSAISAVVPAQSIRNKPYVGYNEITLRDFQENNLSTIEHYTYHVKKNGKVGRDSTLRFRKTYNASDHTIKGLVYHGKSDYSYVFFECPLWTEIESGYDNNGKLLYNTAVTRYNHIKSRAYHFQTDKTIYEYNEFDSLEKKYIITDIRNFEFDKRNQTPKERLVSDTVILEFLYNNEKQLEFVYRTSGKEKVLEAQYFYKGNKLSVKRRTDQYNWWHITCFMYDSKEVLSSFVDSTSSRMLSHCNLYVRKVDFNISDDSVKGFREVLLNYGRGWSDSVTRLYDAQGNLISEYTVIMGKKSYIYENHHYNTYEGGRLHMVHRSGKKKPSERYFDYSSQGFVISESTFQKKKLKYLARYFYR